MTELVWIQGLTWSRRSRGRFISLFGSMLAKIFLALEFNYFLPWNLMKLFGRRMTLVTPRATGHGV